MIKVLLIGPLTPPITGQSTAFSFLVKNFRYHSIVVNTNFHGLSALSRSVQTIKSFFLSARAVLFHRSDAMYISVKRHGVGLLFGFLTGLLYRCVQRGRLVVHVHGSEWSSGELSRTSRILRNALVSISDAVILLTSGMQFGGAEGKSVIIPNFSERQISKVALTKKVHESTSGPLRILYLSNLMATKGVLVLMDAVALARRKGASIELTIAGAFATDSLMSAKRLSTLFEAHPERCRAAYSGVLVGEKKWAELERAHVIALPTFYKSEAQPISLIEGLAFGCVPVTTNHRYNADVLRGSPATLVEPRNAEQLADALLLFANNRIELRERIVKSVAFSERFSSKAYVDSLERTICPMAFTRQR